MKIYFAGSIRGGRFDAVTYHEMISFLKTFGQVLTEHVGDLDLTELGDDGPDDRFIHERDMKWLRNCDVLIAEVSTPSLGVGYELGQACALEKPILCLYKPKKDRPVSAMIAGSPGIVSCAYTEISEAKSLMANFLNRITAQAGFDTA